MIVEVMHVHACVAESMDTFGKLNTTDSDEHMYTDDRKKKLTKTVAE